MSNVIDCPHESDGFFSLAPELIEAISDRLDLDSVKELRLTCKPLGELLSHAVFGTIYIDINRYNHEKCLAKLAALSTGNHAACTSSKKLVIGSLAPVYDPDYRPSLFGGGDEPRATTEILEAEGKMENYLYDAIASLKSVQSVIWKTCRKDSERSQILALKALKTLPNLCRLRVNFRESEMIPVELETFECLQEISLEDIHGSNLDSTLESLAKLVSKQPDINSIDLRISWWERYNKLRDAPPNLHQCLFKYYPDHAPPLRLRHLGLQYCLIRLDEITLPHLKNLTSLDIVHIEDPDSGTQAQREKRRQYGSSPQDIWKTLDTSGIRLEEATLDIITDSFIEYMSSYTGLKKLHLIDCKFADEASSDQMAERFFAEPIGMHARCLEDLRISPEYEGRWCFVSHNILSISQCVNIRTLRLSVRLSDLKVSSGQDALKLMIDMVIASMPHIKNVEISATIPTDLADSDSDNDVGCGLPEWPHLFSIARELEECALRYTAPMSCNRLPTLKIDDGENGTKILVGIQRTLSRPIEELTRPPEEPLRYTFPQTAAPKPHGVGY